MFLSLVLAASPLTTVAEQTHFEKTGRAAEVEALCRALPARFPGKVRCDAFGTTPLGRPMLRFVASQDGVLTPRSARAHKRPVVFFQGGIHAGEIDGKDAGLLLLRDLLEGKAAPGALGRVTLVFVPIFNVDGHERFGPNQRPNQRGPAETGWRVTSQNLNLNRDYTKADAPEMQALLALLTEWDPILFVDLHVTDGAKFQHDVSIALEPWATGPDEMQEMGKALKSALLAGLAEEGHLPLGFYPWFNADDDPSSGFSYGWPPPRFAHSYWSSHNRFGMLVETHSWKDYAKRVQATYDVCQLVLEQAALHGQDWCAAAKKADASAATKAGQEVVLTYEPTTDSVPLEFLGYDYVLEASSVSGKSWVRYDESKPTVWKVPYFSRLKPALVLRSPKGGYVIAPPHAKWMAEKLKLHGIEFRVLAAPRAAAHVRTFRVAARFGNEPREGRQTVQATGEWKDARENLPSGTLFVPAAQPKLFLVMHLLEPQAPDSFVSWGFFNAHFEQKEYLEDYLTEAFAREQLADESVKTEFEARLKVDGFAKDPAARLRFFSARHPSFDSRLNLVPVFQTDESLK